MSQYQPSLSNAYVNVTNVVSPIVEVTGFSGLSVSVATAASFDLKVIWSSDGVTEYSSTTYPITPSNNTLDLVVLAPYVSYSMTNASPVTFSTSVLFITALPLPKISTVVLMSPNNALLPPSTTYRFGPLTTCTFTTDIIRSETVMCVGGYFKYFSFLCTPAATISRVRTFRLLSNGNAIGTFSLPINQTTIVDTSTVASFNAGDKLCWSLVDSNTTESGQYLAISCILFYNDL